MADNWRSANAKKAAEQNMRNAAERHAKDPKALERAVRIVQAGLRNGAITAGDILAVTK